MENTLGEDIASLLLSPCLESFHKLFSGHLCHLLLPECTWHSSRVGAALYLPVLWKVRPCLEGCSTLCIPSYSLIIPYYCNAGTCKLAKRDQVFPWTTEFGKASWTAFSSCIWNMVTHPIATPLDHWYLLHTKSARRYALAHRSNLNLLSYMNRVQHSSALQGNPRASPFLLWSFISIRNTCISLNRSRLASYDHSRQEMDCRLALQEFFAPVTASVPGWSLQTDAHCFSRPWPRMGAALQWRPLCELGFCITTGILHNRLLLSSVTHTKQGWGSIPL